MAGALSYRMPEPYVQSQNHTHTSSRLSLYKIVLRPPAIHPLLWESNLSWPMLPICDLVSAGKLNTINFNYFLL